MHQFNPKVTLNVPPLHPCRLRRTSVDHRGGGRRGSARRGVEGWTRGALLAWHRPWHRRRCHKPECRGVV